MRPRISIGSSALLALAFLFGLTTSGQAGGAAPDVSITVTVTSLGAGSGFEWDYDVTVTDPDSATPIGAIEIPEVEPGYLSATLDASLLVSWSGTEISSPAFGDPILKDGDTPGAWILLTSDNSEYYVGAPGHDSIDFDLFSTLGDSAPTDVSTAFPSNGNYGAVVTVDPLTPTVPEPSTWALMGLGALGLVALRWRKGAPALARA